MLGGAHSGVAVVATMMLGIATLLLLGECMRAAGAAEQRPLAKSDC